MKKTIIIAVSLLSSAITNAQMTLEHNYTNGSNVGYIIGNNANNAAMQVVNLLISGKKYALQKMETSQVVLYNLNHTVWKTINLPTITGYAPITAYYISENLFKVDGHVDMAVFYGATTSTPFPASHKQVIVDEFGSIINTLDSSDIIQIYSAGVDTFKAITGIYTDPSTTYTGGSYQVYSLPGTIPCSSCSSSSLGLMPVSNGNSSAILKVIPNPSNNEAQINYTITGGVTTATIVIIDAVGKSVGTYIVNSNSSYITLNTSSFPSGTYYCTLRGNGVNPVTEKLIITH